MELALSILEFIGMALLQTATLLLHLFGGIFAFGMLLYFSARLSRNAFSKSIGSGFDHYFTGIIGTPVHELGHAFFCLPFGHKITAINLFVFQPRSQTLGYVNHSYNPRNLWHQMGNFFIGIGPILFGSSLMFLLVNYVLVNGNEIIDVLSQIHVSNATHFSAKDLFNDVWKIIQLIFGQENLKSWQFWLAMYVGMSIATHMELSPPDLKGAAKGFLSIVILLFFIQLILQFMDIPFALSGKINQYLTMFNGVLLLSSILSFTFFLFIYILLNIFNLLTKRTMFHPFG